VFPGPGRHPIFNAARMQYAVTLFDMDQFDESVELMLEAVQEATDVFGADSRLVGNLSQRAVQYLAASGYVKEAREASGRALSIVGALVDADSIPYAALLDARSSALLAARRGEEALAASTRARELVIAHLGATHEHTFTLQVHRARALVMIGRADEAQRLLQEANDRYRVSGYAGMSVPLHMLGVATRFAGDPAEAARLQQEALENIRPGHRARRSSARILVELGLSRLELGENAAAREALEEAVAIFRERFRKPTPEYADALVGLGRIALAEERTIDALQHLRVADEFWSDLDPENRWAGEAAFWLGRCHTALGQEEEARAVMARAESILSRSPLPTDAALLESFRAAEVAGQPATL
jgi:tetratricopeptide (TPR) repeat protein